MSVVAFGCSELSNGSRLAARIGRDKKEDRFKELGLPDRRSDPGIARKMAILSSNCEQHTEAGSWRTTLKPSKKKM
uniref:Uncharacterized protein n=1 Tax=Rhizophora mucronata TaxID=61149 RepID=A0A2P2ME09_RHIMU